MKKERRVFFFFFSKFFCCRLHSLGVSLFSHSLSFSLARSLLKIFDNGVDDDNDDVDGGVDFM